MHQGTTLHSTEHCQIIDCSGCGFAHVSPLPSQADLSEYYEKKFYQKSKTSYFSDYERDEEWWKMNYEELLEKYLELQQGPTTKRLLDIGSGPGLFLKVAQDYDFSVLGIEPSEQAFRYSTERYNCKVLNSTIEELDASIHKFDFIHSALVLEHIREPFEFVRKAHQMLENGGLFSVIVPNDFSPIQGINLKLGKHPWWVSPFEHLNYFNKATIKRLFEKTGFDVVYESVSFPIDLFLLMGKDYLANPQEGKESHQMRKEFEFNLLKSDSKKFKQALYSAFSELGIGRELLIIGRKAN